MPFWVRAERQTLSKYGRIKTQILKAGREADYARRAAYNTGRTARRIFEKTTKTWNHPVVFKVETTARGGRNFIAMSVTTDDEIWHYLDKGTVRRYKKSNPLEPYISKTVPGGVFNSGPGSGNMVWSYNEYGDLQTMGGIEARGWSDSPRMKRAMEILLRAQFDQQMSKFRRVMRGEG